MAAKELGLDAVPTLRLSHLSDDERRAYVLADNKLALNAGWTARSWRSNCRPSSISTST
jgi:ParB-like chromosome segregation protein Spo0J